MGDAEGRHAEVRAAQRELAMLALRGIAVVVLGGFFLLLFLVVVVVLLR